MGTNGDSEFIRWSRKMNRHCLSVVIWSALFVMTVVLAGCSQPAVASTAPEDVVDAFYYWYLGYPGNPMVDRAYHDSEYLTQAFKAEVDDILSSFTGGGYDPFLMAQDIPADITVRNASIDGNQAYVTVSQRWAGGFTRELEIELQLVEGEWLINGIVMPETPASGGDGSRPAPCLRPDCRARSLHLVSGLCWWRESRQFAGRRNLAVSRLPNRAVGGRDGRIAGLF
jgi:hypothetical protein